jgi:hypothetical protein
MIGEMSDERKNSTVTAVYRKGDKQDVENYRGINLVNKCYKLYSKILNEKLKARAEKFPLECPNGF